MAERVPAAIRYSSLGHMHDYVRGLVRTIKAQTLIHGRADGSLLDQRDNIRNLAKRWWPLAPEPAFSQVLEKALNDEEYP